MKPWRKSVRYENLHTALRSTETRMQARLKKLGADQRRMDLAKKTLESKRDYLDACLDHRGGGSRVWRS